MFHIFPAPHMHSLPNINIPHQSGNLRHHNHSEPIVYIRVHSWWYTFYGSGQDSIWHVSSKIVSYKVFHRVFIMTCIFQDSIMQSIPLPKNPLSSTDFIYYVLDFPTYY